MSEAMKAKVDKFMERWASRKLIVLSLIHI